MSLDPFFSLSPLSPNALTYDAANPDVPYAHAYLATFGGLTFFFSARSLADQYSNDQILLGLDPVAETDQAIANFANDVQAHCAAWIQFRGVNVSTVNQYLLVFRLAREIGSPIAQIFVGTQFVRGEALTQAPYDDIAILLDTPGNNTLVSMTVRLAAGDASLVHGFYFKGVDCYLL